MTTNWLQGAFASPIDVVDGDTIMGVHASANVRFNANSLLKKANNLSDVASKTTSFDNISPLTTQGDIIYYNGTNNVRLAVGGANQFLISNGTTVAWTASSAAARTAIGLGAASNVAFLNVFAGNSGNAGVVRSYSSTATSGYFGITAVANSGDFSAVISNAAVGQNTVWTLADPANATSNILQAPAALVSGNFVAASGTAGLVVDSGYGVNNIQQYASVAVTATQFKAAYATPFLLVAAPGANNLIVVDKMEMVMTYGTTAYATGGAVFAQYDSTANGAGVKATNTEAAADFFAAASNTFVFRGTSGDTVGALPFTTTVNKGLYLSNATGAFTLGDSAFVVKIHYRIIAVA